MKMNVYKHIWEGWRVCDFIEALLPQIEAIMSYQSYRPAFKDRNELKKWCMENQPYYKKYIPEVVNYFATLYNIK